MHHFKDTLTGKVALVTGAGSGIGKSSARLLAFSGARVAVLGHTRDELERTRDDIIQHGGESIALATDISSPPDLARAMAGIEEQWGRLDILVANAGINGVWASIEELAVEEWAKTLNVNLSGTFFTLKSAIPLMKRGGGGSIVIISSINGTRVFSHTGATAYSVSKAGQVALARMLALEFAPHHIRVNTICPGAIATEIDDNTERRDLDDLGVPVEFPEGRVPLTDGRPGVPGQVAQLVWFLAAGASNHITGTEIFIDGGESLLEG